MSAYSIFVVVVVTVSQSRIAYSHTSAHIQEDEMHFGRLFARSRLQTTLYVVIFKLVDWLLPPYFPYIIHIAFNFICYDRFSLSPAENFDNTAQEILVVLFRAPFHHHRSNFHWFAKTFWPWNHPCAHISVWKIMLRYEASTHRQQSPLQNTYTEKLSHWDSYWAINSVDVHMWALMMACNLILLIIWYALGFMLDY